MTATTDHYTEIVGDRVNVFCAERGQLVVVRSARYGTMVTRGQTKAPGDIWVCSGCRRRVQVTT